MLRDYMTENKRTERRGYIKYVGAAAAGLAVGAGAGWLVGSQQAPLPEEAKPEEICPAAGYIKPTECEAHGYVKESDVPSKCEALGYQKLPEKRTLRVWIFDWEKAFQDFNIRAFQRTYPWIEVKVDTVAWVGAYDKLTVALQGENPPDVMCSSSAWYVPWAEAGLLEPLEDKVATLEGYNEKWEPVKGKDIFEEGAYNLYIYKDHLWVVPYRLTTSLFTYNTAVWGDTPIPTTWSELRSACEKLTHDDVYGWVMDLNDPGHIHSTVYNFMKSNKGGIIADDLSKVIINSPSSLEAFEYLVKFYTDGLMPEECINWVDKDVREFFSTDKVGCLTPEGLQIPIIMQAYGFDAKKIGFFMVPWPDKYVKQTSNTNVASQGYMIPKKARNKEDAWRFIEFEMDPTQHVWYKRNNPVLKALAKHYCVLQSPWVSVALESSKYGSVRPEDRLPQAAEIRDFVLEAMQTACLEKMSPKDALDDAANKISKATGIPIGTQ